MQIAAGLTRALAALTAAGAGAGANEARVCQSPDCLVVENTHSNRGAVRSIGVLDTRLHLYIFAPRETDRFTLGVYDQIDEVPGARPSSFQLYAPDGTPAETLGRPARGAWSDYSVKTVGRWGVWRLTVTGPEDAVGPDGRPLAGTQRARNAFMVRTVGNVDLYLKPEPVARVRGLRLRPPEFGGTPRHEFTIQAPDRSGFRINLLRPATMSPGDIVLSPPSNARSDESRTTLKADDRLKPDVSFSAIDVRSDRAGLWRMRINTARSKGDYGFGVDQEYRIFFNPRPLTPMPLLTPLSTGAAAARVDVTSPQTQNESYTGFSDAHGRVMLRLLPDVQYRLKASRGARFTPATATARAGRGEIRLAPLPIFEIPAGWRSGETHLHTAYYDGSHTPRQMVEAARAAGLDWTFTTEHAHGPITERADLVVSETAPLSTAGEFLVLPGMEFTSATYHANVFGATVGAPAGATLPELLRLVRETGDSRHPTTIAVNHPTLGKSAAALVRATEGVPLLELWNSSEPAATRLWWDLLNQGKRVFAETGSDSHHRVNAEPGFRRTYLRLGTKPLTAANVVRALRQGNSFLSRGAWIDFTIDGAYPGEEIEEGEHMARIEVRSPLPLERIDIISMGEVIHSIPVSGARSHRSALRLTSLGGWRLAQAFAAGEAEPIAMSNPIFCRTRTGVSNRKGR